MRVVSQLLNFHKFKEIFSTWFGGPGVVRIVFKLLSFMRYDGFP